MAQKIETITTKKNIFWGYEQFGKRALLAMKMEN